MKNFLPSFVSLHHILLGFSSRNEIVGDEIQGHPLPNASVSNSE
jgi:hypothetical protein